MTFLLQIILKFNEKKVNRLMVMDWDIGSDLARIDSINIKL